MLKLLTILVSGSIFLSGCRMPLDLGSQSFVGATRIGDGLQVEINKDRITIQLEGKMRGTALSGTLKPMQKHGNAIYTLRGISGLNVAFSADDAVIYTATNGYAKFGVGINTDRKYYVLEDIAGMYNFVIQYFPENHHKFSFGTFEIGTDHSWRMWRMGDGFQRKYQPSVSGYWVDSGEGEIQTFLDNKKLFATLALSQGGNDLLVINLVAKNGIALGVKRNFIRPGSVNGDYSVLSSEGHDLKRAALRDKRVTQGNDSLELIYNEPWDGFFRDSKGEILGLITERGTCFGLNIGAVSGRKFIFAGVKDRLLNL